MDGSKLNRVQGLLTTALPFGDTCDTDIFAFDLDTLIPSGTTIRATTFTVFSRGLMCRRIVWSDEIFFALSTILLWVTSLPRARVLRLIL
ncbi:MAG: hypothetical protein DMG58_23680 [Acidobacteria bacterium]|nr:MAG: hypothetical protein DMG58_23680 [Acidobacteriota bacterium]